MTIPFSLPSKTIQANNFNLIVTYFRRSTKIEIHFLPPYLYTSSFPQTLSVLRSFLPDIFKCKCFNDGEFEFCDEARDTELGHLFEHILLEYLYETKLAGGINERQYRGETSWDWDEDEPGIFHIDINSGLNDHYCFNYALAQSTQLLSSILANAS